MASSIASQDLLKKLRDPELVLIDARPTAAYNGWKLQQEARGGHIRGAVSFPLSWTDVVTGADLVALLASKGITPDRSVVVYGYGRDGSLAMAGMLRHLDYEDVLTYDAGLAEWAADDSLPMARLANFEKLVHPGWVRSLFSGENPDTYRGQGFVVFEVSSEERRENGVGHIPGALPLHTNAIEEEPTWNRVSDARLEEILPALGITADTTVVLYGKDTTAAARVASVLMYAGVEDVRLLDGGLDAWTAAGYDLETGTREPVPAEAFGRGIPGHPEYIIDAEDMKAALADGQAVIVSVRSWAEYVGETSGYTFVHPRGRIAGAVWGHSGSDPHHMEDFRNVDNTMRSYHEIASRWRDVGIAPDKRVVFYCGTGWRASEAFFYAYLMGWTDIAVYDGGWLEWSRDGSNPVESGVPAGRNGVSK